MAAGSEARTGWSAIQHHREEGRLFLIVVEVQGFQLRQLGGFGHRVVEVAEAVDRPLALASSRSRRGPGDLVDFLRRALRALATGVIKR